MEILLLNKKKEGFGMESIILELNNFLADLNVFYRKLQNYHWYIEGEHFFVLHEKLEEYYNTVNEQIDEVAEHILTLEGMPLGTMKDYLEVTSIEEAKNKGVSKDEVIKNVKKDYTKLLRKVEDIKKKADAKDCFATSSIMDEYIVQYSKIIWMLNQLDK